MKKLPIAGLSAALVVGFSARSSQSTSSGGNSGGGRVALVAKANSVEYWVKVEERAEAADKELGVDVSFNGPGTESKGDGQPSQLQSAVNDKSLGIGSTSQDGAQDGALVPTDRAKESGVSVAIFDISLNGSDVPVATVTSDSKDMGARAAKKLIALTGDKGKVAIITHGEIGTAAAQRGGFKEHLAKNTPELQVVGVQNGESDPAKSCDKAQGILQAYPGLVGFSGTDDDSTIAIVDEVVAKSLQTEMVSVGSSPNVISLLEQGGTSGIVVRNSYDMGRKTVELTVAAPKDENPAEKDVVSELVWVTTENLKDPDVQQIAN